MSTVPPDTRPRHALNMPAGSIRAMLAFGVLGYLWLLALQPERLKEARVSVAFIYLQALMLLILSHFFTAHGSTIGSKADSRSPLGLPRGSVRLLLLTGYLGLAAYLWLNKPKFELTLPQQGEQLLVLPALLLTAFFVGHYLTGVVRFVSGGTLPAWFQDFEAWVALVSLFLLGIVVIVEMVINTSLPFEGRLDVHYIEAALAAGIGFYFGARW
jgi:hypothetical protein